MANRGRVLPALRPTGDAGAWWVLVGAITVVALVLRIPGVSQSLALDEMLTFGEIHAHPLTDLIHQMRAAGEDNPPLYYGLAWFTAQLGDDTVAIRLPSLILGTAAVPLVFALGARTVGRAPGALAAALAAISPFAIFYSAEARGYSTAIFFSALATLALLRALRLRDWRWWAADAAAVVAVLYTHDRVCSRWPPRRPGRCSCTARSGARWWSRPAPRRPRSCPGR